MRQISESSYWVRTCINPIPYVSVMIVLLMLTSPIWPLLLLVAIDKLQVFSLQSWPERSKRIPSMEERHEIDETREEVVKPPSFFMQPANLPGIISDRARRSRERARRMGMDTVSRESF
jgi:hypothetical protein